MVKITNWEKIYSWYKIVFQELQFVFAKENVQTESTLSVGQMEWRTKTIVSFTERLVFKVLQYK